MNALKVVTLTADEEVFRLIRRYRSLPRWWHNFQHRFHRHGKYKFGKFMHFGYVVLTINIVFIFCKTSGYNVHINISRSSAPL